VSSAKGKNLVVPFLTDHARCLTVSPIRSTSIKTEEGKQFHITPELISIEKKTFKQSSA
jgi:hypothetical protein